MGQRTERHREAERKEAGPLRGHDSEQAESPVANAYAYTLAEIVSSLPYMMRVHTLTTGHSYSHVIQRLATLHYSLLSYGRRRTPDQVQGPKLHYTHCMQKSLSGNELRLWLS